MSPSSRRTGSRPGSGHASPARSPGCIGFDLDVHAADEAQLRLTAHGPIRIDVEYGIAPTGEGSSEVAAAVAVSGGGGLRGRLLAEATDELLGAGALRGALGRIAREASAWRRRERAICQAGRVDPRLARLWWRKWRWYERNSLPWNRARIHLEMARRSAFARWPVHGNVLEALREGRLVVGEHALLEPHVWLTAPAPGRIRIGAGTFLNVGVMVAAVELVEIGPHCMLANGCFVSDGNHRFDDPDRPVPWQGFTTKGPTRIGANAWLGAHVVVTSGVTIGERCVVGANSVVTRDLPPGTIAAGAPARVLGHVEYGPGPEPDVLVAAAPVQPPELPAEGS